MLKGSLYFILPFLVIWPIPKGMWPWSPPYDPMIQNFIFSLFTGLYITPIVIIMLRLVATHNLITII